MDTSDLTLDDRFAWLEGQISAVRLLVTILLGDMLASVEDPKQILFNIIEEIVGGAQASVKNPSEYDLKQAYQMETSLRQIAEMIERRIDRLRKATDSVV